MANRFTGVEGFQQRQLFAMGFHQVGKFMQHRFALGRGGLRPVAAIEDAAGGLDRAIDVALFAARDLGERLLGGRVDGGEHAIIGGGAVFAVNK